MEVSSTTTQQCSFSGQGVELGGGELGPGGGWSW